MNARFALTSCFTLSLVALSASAHADTVMAATPSGGQVVAVGCTSVAVDANGSGAAAPNAPCPVTPAREAPKTHWYGWQTLLADGAAVTLTMAATNGREGLGWAALGVYALGGPTVHALHGAPAKVGASLLLRVGAPLALGFGGYALGSSGNDGHADVGGAVFGALGAFVGLAGAIAVDSAVLARETVDAPPPSNGPAATKAEARAASSIRISPTFTPRAGGGTVGAVGMF